MPGQRAGRHHKVACLLIKIDDMWVKGVATDCWQDGVRQFYRNKSISGETKTMVGKIMKFIG
jgi:hypothetical protein